MSAHLPRVLAMPRPEVEVRTAALPAESILDRVIFSGLLAVLMGAPLAMGAVSNWAAFALEAAATLLLALWMARALVARSVQMHWPALFGPAIAFALVIAAQLVFRLSAVRFETFSGALRYAAYAMLMFVAAQAARTREDLRRLAMVFAVFGSLVALFAIVQDLTYNGLIYWTFKPVEHTRIFGPYVNRNHFAGLMELLTPLPLALAILLPRLTAGKRALLTFAGIVMGASIVLSMSRGGMLSLLAEIVLLGLYVARRRALRPAAMLAGICLLMGAFLWWVGSEQLLQRFSHAQEGEGLSSNARVEILHSSLAMFRERPVAGWGLGTFTTVFPPFRTFYGDPYINEAHDDYAQALVETGILGFAAVVWFLALFAAAAWRQFRRADMHLAEVVRLGLLLGCCGLLVHSFFDFNLHVPANAALFYVFAVLAVDRERPSRLLR